MASARAALHVVEGRAEAALASRWRAGIGGALRLEDGRIVRVVYPGGEDPGSGPDCPGAVLDIDGDLVRGDVEVHLRASGWRAHGHDRDPAYAGVVLHVVDANDEHQAMTRHGRRLIPILVLPHESEGGEVEGEAFLPPCALTCARAGPAATLERISLRRLRAKAAAVDTHGGGGAGGALWQQLLTLLGGSVNRAAFTALGRQLPLAVLLDRASGHEDRPLAFAAELRHAARSLSLHHAGMRPMARPAARIEVAARLAARLWAAGSPPGWPAALEPAPARTLLRTLQVDGAGRSTAIELAVNAVLPVALASGQWPPADVEAAWLALPSPGTYGQLQRLDRWLAHGNERPFATAARLQGGLVLHREYCTRGRCGRCPLSS